MSSTLYFRGVHLAACDAWGPGQNTWNPNSAIDTSGQSSQYSLRFTRGSSKVQVYRATAASSTTRRNFVDAVAKDMYWVSAPLDRDVTISGTCTANLWVCETNMSANIKSGCYVAAIKPDGTLYAQIADGTASAEMAVDTTEPYDTSVQNFTLTVSSTALHKGDRLLVVPYFTNSGTQASGYTGVFDYDGNNVSGAGDSYITFTEDFGYIESVGDLTSIQQGSPTLTIGSASSDQKRAMQVYVPNPRTLTSVTVWLNKTGSPSDNIVLALQADSSGNPSGTDLASASIAGSTISTIETGYAFDIADTALSADTVYWVVLRRSGANDASNYYKTVPNEGESSWRQRNKYDNAGTWTADTNRWAYVTLSLSAGSSLYPTTTTGQVDPNGASYDSYEFWTSRGSGATSAVTNTRTAGAASLVTTSAGGNYIEWFSRQVQACTLSGAVLVNVRAAESNASANHTIAAEIAVTASDGTSASVWNRVVYDDELTTSEAAYQFFLSGDDVSITDGQRLRLRLYIDDPSSAPGASAGYTVTAYYAGSAGASGDTYLTFPITLTATGGDASISLTTLARSLVINTPTKAGDANLTTTAVAVAVAIPSISVVTTTPVALTTVLSTVAVNQTTITAEARAPPNAVAAPVVVGTTTQQADATVVLNAVACPAAVASPTTTADANVALTRIAVVAVIDGVTVDTGQVLDASVDLSTVARTAIVDGAAVAADASPIRTRTVTNNANGGTPPDAVTVGNSGGASGTAFSSVSSATYTASGYSSSVGIQLGGYVRWVEGLVGSPRDFEVTFKLKYGGWSGSGDGDLLVYADLGPELWVGTTGKVQLRDAAQVYVRAETTTAMSVGSWYKLTYRVVEHQDTPDPYDGFMSLQLYTDPESSTPTETISATTNTAVGDIASVWFYGPSGGSPTVVIDDLSYTGNFLGVPTAVWVRQATISAAATVELTTVSSAATVPAPSVSAETGGADASVPLSTVARPVAVNAPTITAAANVDLTRVAVLAAVGGVNVSTGGDVNIGLSTVARSAAVPSPTIEAAAAVTLSAVVVTVATSTPAVTLSAEVALGTVAVAATPGAPTATAAAAVTPTAIAATAATQAPTLTADGNVALTRVAVLAAVPTISVAAGGSINVALSTVALTASVGAVTVTAASDAALTRVAVAPATNAPTKQGDANVSRSAVAVAAAVNAPTTTAAAAIALTRVACTVTVQAAATADAGIARNAVAVSAAVNAPTKQADANVPLTRVAVAPVIGAPTLSTSQTVALARVAVVAAVPAITAGIWASVARNTVAVSAVVPAPTITLSSNAALTRIAVGATIPGVTVDLVNPSQVFISRVAVAAVVPTPTKTAAAAVGLATLARPVAVYAIRHPAGISAASVWMPHPPKVKWKVGPPMTKWRTLPPDRKWES